MTTSGPVLELRNVSKDIPRPGKEPFPILTNINLSVREGEFVSVVGPSGCGKTTMLRVVNGLMPASGGEILVDGKAAEQVSDQLLMGFRLSRRVAAAVAHQSEEHPPRSRGPRSQRPGR
jgi:NitT/TauT family transport system ATP-binding protein